MYLGCRWAAASAAGWARRPAAGGSAPRSSASWRAAGRRPPPAPAPPSCSSRGTRQVQFTGAYQTFCSPLSELPTRWSSILHRPNCAPCSINHQCAIMKLACWQSRGLQQERAQAASGKLALLCQVTALGVRKKLPSAHPSMERGGLGPEAAIDARTDSSSTQYGTACSTQPSC